MNYSDLRDAREAAISAVAMADSAVAGAVKLAAGRLRIGNCHEVWLKKLKLELRDFNAVTGKWKVKS